MGEGIVKIIGRQDQSHIIVVMSESELMKISGSTFSVVGADVNVTDRWQLLCALNGRFDRMKRLCDAIDGVGTLLKSSKEQLDAIVGNEASKGFAP